MLTVERLREVLRYDAATGEFSVGGRQRHDGYIRVSVDGVRYLAHRLAWLYFHGAWPSGIIDHIDRDRANNRIENLRDVSQSVNQQNIVSAKSNSRSGLLGAAWCQKTGRWAARIRIHGIKVHLMASGRRGRTTSRTRFLFEMPSYPKQPRQHDKEYRRFVAAQNCFSCGVEGYSQCAHRNGGGMGTKHSDFETFPLCCARPGMIGCHAMHDLLLDMTLEQRKEAEDIYVERMQRIAAEYGWKL